MANHPNRGPKGPYPSPQDVQYARKLAGLSQTAAASMIHCSLRAWQQWEAGERKMHPAMWELFNVKRSQAQKVEK